jgi:uncharacterized protein (DUF1330 family)
MPAGYIIAIVDVTDLDKYKAYAADAGPATLKYGGKYLARGGPFEVLEGSFSGKRFVVLEFESVEKAKTFYHSPEYQAARKHRLGGANFNMVVVEGA